MALDVGERRIGIAISDALQMLATPVLTLTRRSYDHDVAAIIALAQQRGVVRILVGYPLHMDGSLSAQANISARFAERLREALQPHGPEVELWDERLSTQEAASLLDAGARGRAGLDALAAAVFLQEWLNQRRGPVLVPPPPEWDLEDEMSPEEEERE